jgi:hypothetical protein
MVEAMVVKETISSEMIDAGAALIRRLDHANLLVSAAFWLYLPESNAWRLMIASPEVRSQGPRKIYQRIQPIIAKMETEGTNIGLNDISVVENNDPLIEVLRKAVKTSSNGISGIRFSKNTIDGHFIEDAYIYRLA